VLHHRIGHELRLLVSNRAHFGLIELAIRSCGVELLAQVLALRLSRLFSLMHTLKQCFDLRLLFRCQIQCLSYVVHHAGVIFSPPVAPATMHPLESMTKREHCRANNQDGDTGRC
jgi:hypothetical protein